MPVKMHQTENYEPTEILFAFMATWHIKSTIETITIFKNDTKKSIENQLRRSFHVEEVSSDIHKTHKKIPYSIIRQTLLLITRYIS